MARKGLNGQMNMFDFFRELEAQSPAMGDPQMVSLMPSYEEEDIPVQEVKPKQETKPRQEAKPKQETEPRQEAKPKQETEPRQEVKPKKEPDMKQEIIPEEKLSEEEPPKEQKPARPRQPGNGKDAPVMKRTYQIANGVVEIAYISYNKVRITEPGTEPQMIEFDSSKEAVDYYVDQMQKLEELYKGEE